MYDKQYEVMLSFAGDDRAYAEALADALHQRGVNVFYDKYEISTLWGKNLYTHLSDLYQHRARYCIMFLSKHYAAKLWTNHERAAAQARAFQENEEYILPIRLDNTEIPGILPTISYLSWQSTSVEAIADAVLEKLGKSSEGTSSTSSTTEIHNPDISSQSIAQHTTKHDPTANQTVIKAKKKGIAINTMYGNIYQYCHTRQDDEK